MTLAPAAATPSASAFPVLRSLRGSSIEQTADFEPHVDEAEFMSSAVRDGAMVVVRLRGTDLDCGALRADATTPGYEVELLPLCTLQGDDVLVGVRVHRRADTRSRGCEVRFCAGVSAVHAMVMVRPASER